jgi:hypothetical protein
VFRKLVWFLLALGLGAVAYSLVRGEPTVAGAAPAGAGDERGNGPPPGPGDRCAATTGSGRRCRREAEPGSPYCWQHGG